MVERTAHNGFVVGSIPTKLKFMELKLKNYKRIKIKKILKKIKMIFLFHSINENSKKWTLIEQNLFKNKFNYYKMNKSLSNLILKDSIFFNLVKLINGPILALHLNFFFEKKNLVKKIFDTNNNSNLYMLCLIFKNKFYHIKSLFNMIKFKFKYNIKFLIFFFKQWIYNLFVSNFLLLNKNIISK
jgi:hypothetical protein